MINKFNIYYLRIYSELEFATFEQEFEIKNPFKVKNSKWVKSY